MRVLTFPAGLLAVTLCFAGEATCASHHKIPKAATVNGTYAGKYLSGFDQDVFLGMRFAQPASGQRRFQRPHYINESFDGVRQATEYGPTCPQYSPPNAFPGDASEDCLSINVIRPAGTSRHEKLPILVWLYGGGFDGGGTSDPRYNLSGIVRLSQDMGKPIIGVSFNYRLNKLGFLQMPELVAEGSSNAGMHDQRLALMWIQENIVAFGGDPKRVTWWGESAGAQAIGLQMFAYDGYVQALAQSMGCEEAAAEDDDSLDLLQCLRDIPFDKWQNTTTTSLIWNPMVDGELWSDYPSILAQRNKFLKIPVIIGTNSDEGCNFATKGLDTEEEMIESMLSYRGYEIRPFMAKRLLELYPNDPSIEPPYYLNPDPVIFPDRGLMWRRTAAIEGDMVMVAGRRRVAEQMTAAGQPVYSYRFDTIAVGQDPQRGVTHFQNVAYSFQNISGNLGPLPEYASHRKLSEDIGRAYVSFVHDHDPNTSRGKGSKLPKWPVYDLKYPKNIVLNASGSWVENDTYRKEGIAYLNEVASDLQILA